MKRALLAFVVAALPLHAGAESYPDAERVVTIGGPVTETVYALGESHRIVARDTTSRYPASANDLPDVGYMRQLSAEGVLSVKPDLILTRDTAGPPDAMDQLRAAAVPMVEVHDAFTAAAVTDAVRTLGEALGVQAKAEELAQSIEAQLSDLAQSVASGPKPRVMFILSNQAGRLNVSGGATGAHGIMELAGAQNVFADEYDGYKIASNEAIIAAAPDVILMMEPTGEAEHDARRDEVLALPAIRLTPAGQNKAFVLINPAALGFGPRTAEFATTLRARLLGAGEG